MQNRIKLKRVHNWLRDQTKQLPIDTYIALDWIYIPPIESERGKREGEWKKYPKEFPVNHLRRTYRLYKKYGLEAVNAYFLKYGFAIGSY